MVSGRKLFMSPGAPNRVHNHSPFSQRDAHTSLMSQTTATEVKPTAPPSWHLAYGRPHLSVLRGLMSMKTQRQPKKKQSSTQRSRSHFPVPPEYGVRPIKSLCLEPDCEV